MPGGFDMEPQKELIFVVLLCFVLSNRAAAQYCPLGEQASMKTCGSLGGKANCTVGNEGDVIRTVWLITEISPCSDAEDYGFYADTNILWVDNGCNGVFSVCLKSCPGEILSVPCAGPGYRACSVGSGDKIIENARVAIQESTAECNYNDGNYLNYTGTPGSFGFEKNIIWVDKGCNATFRVCLVPGCSGNVTFINCSSDGGYQTCLVPIRGQIIYATHSSAQCVNQGYAPGPQTNVISGDYGWFYDNLLWVDHGCAGEFEICYLDNCLIKGDPHVTTHDGKKYTYGGDSNYTLVDHLPTTLAIYGDFFKCRPKRPHVSCLLALIIAYENYRIELMRGGSVSVFNPAVLDSGPVSLNYSSEEHHVAIYEVLHNLIKVELSNGVTIYWDKRKVAWINLPFDFLGNTMGLCGTYDYNQLNDFMTAAGIVTNDVHVFAESWAVEMSGNNGGNSNGPS